MAKRFGVVLTLLMCVSMSASAAEALDALLQRQTQEMVDAIAAGTTSVWDRYLDDGAIITTEDGAVQSKQEFLKELHPLPAGVSGTIAVTDFKVHPHGAVAIATYDMDEHENYHGHMLHCHYRATDTWQKSDGGWRLIASQILAERADPPAVAMPAALAAEYVGKYALTPQITYEIRRTADGLEGCRGGKCEPLRLEAPDVLFTPGKTRYRKIILRDAAHHITGFADRREAWDLVWAREP